MRNGERVPFADIEQALAKMETGVVFGEGAPENSSRPLLRPDRIRVATVIVVGAAKSLAEAGETLLAIAPEASVRGVLVPITRAYAPIEARVAARCAGQPGERHSVCAELISLEPGVPARFVGNVLSALRAPDLPAYLWWRSASEAGLRDAAPLVDRLVLDAADPLRIWQRLPRMSVRKAGRRALFVSDLRWAALTDWRAAVAQAFDDADGGARLARIEAVTVASRDRFAAALLAGWLASSLGWKLRSREGGAIVFDAGGRTVKVRLKPDATSETPKPDATSEGLKPDATSEAPNPDATKHAIDEIVLRIADGGDVVAHASLGAGALAAAAGGGCLQVRSGSRPVCVTPRGRYDRAALLRRELRIRGRDEAFERAAAAAVEMLA